MIELAVRVVLSLGVVLGLLWLVARMASARTGGRRAGLVTVHARQPLGRNAYLSVVTVGDRALLVGVTEHQVNLISELPSQLLDTLEPTVLHALPCADTESTEAVDPPQVTRRATHRGGARRAARSGAQSGSILSGSILSGQTWKQTFAAVSARTAGRS